LGHLLSSWQEVFESHPFRVARPLSIIGLLALACLFVLYIYPNYLTPKAPPGPELIDTHVAGTIIARLTQTGSLPSASVAAMYAVKSLTMSAATSGSTARASPI